MSSSETKSKRPTATAFKQQQLKACQPILTPLPVITVFLVLGVVFIPVGVVLLVYSNQVIEVSQRYDNLAQCSINSTCSISLYVEQTMKSPFYFYYGLDNFYQNHRRFVKSRSDTQLRGEDVSSYSALSDCEPRLSVDDSTDPAEFYLPCGLIAWSLFNDTFQLQTGNQTIPLEKNGIAWKSDVEQKFHNLPPNSTGVRVIQNFTNEDFIVWMRTAGLPNFKKLYGIIYQDLNPGYYNVTIVNNYPVEQFSGKKYVILSTTTWLGGKNPFLGYAYIVVGCICFAQGVIFGVKHAISPRKLGDTRYLRWNK